MEIFNLAAECQALSTDLAKQFQKLPGLMAMHHTMAQATAHKTSNAGWLAWEAVYSASSIVCVGQPQDKKYEQTIQQLLMPRLTRFGKMPMTWCSSISCIMMNN